LRRCRKIYKALYTRMALT